MERNSNPGGQSTVRTDAASAKRPFGTTDNQLHFLGAIRRLPDANAKFLAVRNPRTLGLVRDGLHNQGQESELHRLLEEWADGCNLGRKPISDWWIFDVVTDWLVRIVRSELHGPEQVELDEVESADNLWSYPWNDYCSGRTVIHRLDDLRVSAFDPSIDTAEDYRSYAIERVDKYISSQLRHFTELGGQRPRSNQTHYTWLVQSQILGLSCEQIASQCDEWLATETIRTTIFELRKVIDLPSIRKRGRPRKIVG
jgi:hypothetical protein